MLLTTVCPGLTPTKLILAQYAVKPIELEDITGGPDPDIDSFELVCAYPVDCVNLSAYRTGRRKTIKASFCNGKVHFFEIGGWQERKVGVLCLPYFSFVWIMLRYIKKS